MAAEALALLGAQLGHEGRGHALGHLVLDGEEVGELLVEVIGPEGRAARRRDELQGEPQPVPGALEPPVEDRVDLELTAGGHRVDVRIREAAHGAGGAHRDPAGRGEPRDERVGHAEAESEVGFRSSEGAEGEDGEAAGSGGVRAHRAQEAVAPPGDGLDPGPAVGLVPEGLAEDGHVDAEVRLLDERVGPHAPQELLLRHDLARLAGERGEEIHGLRGDVEQGLPAPHQAPPAVEPEGAEFELRRAAGHRAAF